VNDIRYHHIIDPREGWPARACQAVTVLAQTAEEADVLATAIFVLGPVKGLEIADTREMTEVFVIDRSGEFWMSDGFKEKGELL
jgi:thiamine biosynthesis lipoprotein